MVQKFKKKIEYVQIIKLIKFEYYFNEILSLMYIWTFGADYILYRNTILYYIVYLYTIYL